MDMEVIMAFFGILFAILFFFLLRYTAILCVYIGYIVGAFVRYVVFSISLRFNPKMRRLQHVMPRLLHQYSPYYQSLNYKEQKRFQKRIIRFISLKRFYRFDKSEATDEMKILIASAAVQMTFGYPKMFEFEVFDKIAVSDKEYVSQQTKNVHEGEANPGKSLLAFSWKRFMEGVKNPYDCINLGLHEFAHALFLCNFSGYLTPDFKEMIHKWHAEVAKIAQEPAAHNFFRHYAFENKMEFFAVAMEYFFENPKAFHSHFPQLYEVMCRLLNQNPLLPNNGIVRKWYEQL